VQLGGADDRRRGHRRGQKLGKRDLAPEAPGGRDLRDAIDDPAIGLCRFCEQPGQRLPVAGQLPACLAAIQLAGGCLDQLPELKLSAPRRK
jgi:hypothetical protein